MASSPALDVLQFRELGTVVDDVHRLFDQWEREGLLAHLGDFRFNVLRFAVHEWVANLVQHADFGARSPLIRFALQPDGDHVHCTLEDNSKGFDFHDQLRQQRSAVESPLPPDRGRGLLMLIACTENLRYHQPLVSADSPEEQWHRLTFSISANKQLWIDIPF